MAQKAKQQKVREEQRGPAVGPSTPVVITGGGTYPIDPLLPSMLHIGPKDGSPPLVFEVVAPGPAGTQRQWVQSRSASAGLIESVVVDELPAFLVPKHPITISILATAGSPLLTITEMRESEGEGYRMFLSSNDPGQPFTAEGQGISGEGWTESLSDSPLALGRIFIGGDGAPLSPASTIQVNFLAVP